MLAEREGLNASDYLRSLLRQMAGTPPHLAQVIRLGAVLGGKLDLTKLAESYASTAKAKRKNAK